VLQDLDSTLLAFLRAELPAALKDTSISFAAPDDKFPPTTVTLPAFSLFLSGIQENRDLRATESIVTRLPNNGTSAHRPPARVDCYYLATAFSGATSSNPEEDEHQMLGELMRTFFRFRELPSQMLQGSLQNQVIPIRVSTPLPTTRESGVDMWQAFKVKPRASLHYTFTISVDPGYPADPSALVTSVQTQAPASQPAGFYGVDSLQSPVAIKGTVTDALTAQPLAGALIQLTLVPDAFAALLSVLAQRHGAEWDFLPVRPDRTRTGADGSFGFLDLPDGTYALSVTLPSAGLRYGSANVAGVAVAHNAQGGYNTALANAALPPTAISGLVLGSTAPISRAQVRIVGSGEMTFTSQSGAYSLSAIEPGARSLEFTAPGFAAKTQDGIVAQEGATITVPDVHFP
jgi:hypothetical protein